MIYLAKKNKKNLGDNILTLLDKDNKLISDDKIVAPILTLTFKNFTKENNAAVPNTTKILESHDENKFPITKAQTHEGHNYLQKIDQCKSIGHDYISQKATKKCYVQSENSIM